MKRGTDHSWECIQFWGDAQIYAKCKCGFFYGVGLDERDEHGWMPPTKPDPTKMYLYCPYCGARKKRYTDYVRKTNQFLIWHNEEKREIITINEE